MMSNWCKKGVSMMFNCCLISERIIMAKYLFVWDIKHIWSRFFEYSLALKDYKAAVFRGPRLPHTIR
jgi:hypothetical protein